MTVPSSQPPIPFTTDISCMVDWRAGEPNEKVVVISGSGNGLYDNISSFIHLAGFTTFSSAPCPPL